MIGARFYYRLRSKIFRWYRQRWPRPASTFAEMKARQFEPKYARWARTFTGNGIPSHKLPARSCPLYD